jgi:hypothetical protein
MILRALIALAALLPVLAAAVALDPALTHYAPREQVSGEVTVAGNHATDEAMLAWARRFARYQPAVRIVVRNDTRLTTDAFDNAIGATATARVSASTC